MIKEKKRERRDGAPIGNTEDGALPEKGGPKPSDGQIEKRKGISMEHVTLPTETMILLGALALLLLVRLTAQQIRGRVRMVKMSFDEIPLFYNEDGSEGGEKTIAEQFPDMDGEKESMPEEDFYDTMRAMTEDEASYSGEPLLFYDEERQLMLVPALVMAKMGEGNRVLVRKMGRILRKLPKETRVMVAPINVRRRKAG